MDVSLSMRCALLWVVCVLVSSGCVQSGGGPQVTIEENVSVTEEQTSTTTSSTTTSSSAAPTTTKAATTIPATSAPTSTTIAASSGRVQILIANRSFIPQNLTIRADTIVTWVNNDSSEHQIISDVGFAGKSGGFSRQISDLKSSRLFRGSTYSYRFRRVGNFTYHCNIYPGIRGSIQVLP